jgi:error-prone DNA polymerase
MSAILAGFSMGCSDSDVDSRGFWCAPDYAELQCFSNFSFLRGASHADDIAARAAQLGYSAIAITDECSLAGVVRAHVEAKKAGIPYVVGSGSR